MKRFTKRSLSTQISLSLDFSVKNEHSYRITDVSKSTINLSVLLYYTFIEKPLAQLQPSILMNNGRQKKQRNKIGF